MTGLVQTASLTDSLTTLATAQFVCNVIHEDSGEESKINVLTFSRQRLCTRNRLRGAEIRRDRPGREVGRLPKNDKTEPPGGDSVLELSQNF